MVTVKQSVNHVTFCVGQIFQFSISRLYCNQQVKILWSLLTLGLMQPMYRFVVFGTAGSSSNTTNNT